MSTGPADAARICDCGHAASFRIATLEKCIRDSQAGVVQLGDGLVPEHIILFHQGKILFVICPHRTQREDRSYPEEHSSGKVTGPRSGPRVKATREDVHLDRELELIVFATKSSTVRCQLLGTNRELTFKSADLWRIVPGQIITVEPRKFWVHQRHPYLSGGVVKDVIDIPRLGLVPLELHERGPFDPAEEYWGEPGDPIHPFIQEIVAHGKRPCFEMEQVLPGMDAEDPDDDPIQESIELRDAGDHEGSDKVLMDLLSRDLRCLDAHAHLGNFEFSLPDTALRHFEVGMRIAELSLPPGKEPVLMWGMIDNRPFLRCLKGYGLCLWRLGRFEEAAGTFERLLWLNPADNQGARLILDEVRKRLPWKADGDR